MVGLRKPINRYLFSVAKQAELPRPKPHQDFGLLDPLYLSLLGVLIG
jgi:hypothetical protein